MRNTNELITIAILSCVTIIIGYTILFGNANVYYNEDFVGKDVVKFETRTDTPEFSDNAQTRNTSWMHYNGVVDWGKQNIDSDGNNVGGQTATSSFEFDNAEYGYYKVVYSGSGYKNKFIASNVKGDFRGSAKVVTLETGVPETDALVLMDGDMTYFGQIVNGHTGRPVTERETYSIGNLTIQSYFNASISDKKTSDENWLGSCGDSYKDAMLDSGGNGVYIQPYGYYIDDSGILHKDMKYWRLNETTNLMELIPRYINTTI